jgi:hypothetical protein
VIWLATLIPQASMLKVEWWSNNNLSIYSFAPEAYNIAGQKVYFSTATTNRVYEDSKSLHATDHTRYVTL